MAKHCYKIYLVKPIHSNEILFACIGGHKTTLNYWYDLCKNVNPANIVFAARLKRLPKRYNTVFYGEYEFHDHALVVLENLRCTIKGIIVQDSTKEKSLWQPEK